MTSKRTVKWTMSNGKEITVEIEVSRQHVTSERNNADGDVSMIDVDRVAESQSIVAYLDDAKFAVAYMGTIERNVAANDRGIVAAIGGKVGLVADTYKMVTDAIADATAEAESDPEIVACHERIARREAAFDAVHRDYDAAKARIEAAMNQ